MTVTFNDVVLADGESRTAKVASGLAPSGALNFEPLEYLRAAWAVPVARGNRLITLPMIIEIPPFTTFGASLVSGLSYFANLPAEGPLIIAEGDDHVAFSNAVCVECKIVDEIIGVSYAVALRFVCGQPVTLSPLALMNINAVCNLYKVTGLTGGGETNLDGWPTADVLPGFRADIFATIGGLKQDARFRLFASEDLSSDATQTDPLAGPVIVRPADYHATTNPKAWARIDA